MKEIRELDNLAYVAIENDTLSFIAFDGEGRIITCNSAFVSLTGFVKQELDGKRWPHDFIIKDELNNVLQELREIGCTTVSRVYQRTLIKNDGGQIPIETFLHQMCDDNGKILLYYSFISDISERVREIGKIKRMSDIVESSNDAILGLNFDGTITEWNRGAERLYRYTAREMIGKNIAMLIPETRRYEISNIFDIIRQGVSVVNYDTKRVRKDGSFIDISLTASPITTSASDIVGISWVSHDISNLVKEREALRSALEESSAIMSIVTNAVSTIGIENLMSNILIQLLDVTKANAGVILLKEDGMVCVKASIGVEEAVQKKFCMKVGEGFAGVIAETGEHLYIENAQINPRIYSPYIRSAGIRSMLGVPLKYGMDVIGVLHIDWREYHPFKDHELNILKTSAERCSSAIINAQLYEKMKDSQHESQMYLDLMSHDINNMNMASLGYLELFIDELKQGKTIEKDDELLLERAHNIIANSSKLIDNIRRLQEVRCEIVPEKPEDLCNILKEVQNRYTGLPNRDIKINPSFKKECPIDVFQLAMDVVDNIVSNAVKHSDPKIPLEIDIDVSAVEEGGTEYYKVVIEDNGPGIPDELKGRLFNRFVRGDTKVFGRGLGLYLADALVKSVSGKVWVEDRVPGDYRKGSRFIVMLPAKIPPCALK